MRRSFSMDDQLQKFDGPDNDKSQWKHFGRTPRITKSTLESKNYHALHSRLYDGMHRFFSSKNIVHMICRSGRHRYVAKADSWSNTLARCSRHQYSVSLLHLSELDFWEIRVQEKVRNATNSLSAFCRHTSTVSKLSVHNMLPCPIL